MSEHVFYRCTNPDCGATDFDRGAGSQAPAFLNCWKCKAGYKVDPQVMAQRRIGMFPVAEEEVVN